MATVEDELAALKDMLDQQVINEDEYLKMSDNARKRHGVRQANPWTSQSQRAKDPTKDAAFQNGASSGPARTTSAGGASSTNSSSKKSSLGDKTYDQLINDIGTGVTNAVTGQGAKSKNVAALLALFLGVFGAQKLYLGYTKEFLIMLAITVFGSIAFGIGPLISAFISLAEFFIYLTRSPEEFERTYVQGHKGFF